MDVVEVGGDHRVRRVQVKPRILRPTSSGDALPFESGSSRASSAPSGPANTWTRSAGTAGTFAATCSRTSGSTSGRRAPSRRLELDTPATRSTVSSPIAARTTSASASASAGGGSGGWDRDDPHPRGMRGADPVARVLDGRAALGRQVESPRRLEKDVGCRLAAADLLGRDGRLEGRGETRRLEHGVDHTAVRRRREREPKRLRQPQRRRRPLRRSAGGCSA